MSLTSFVFSVLVIIPDLWNQSWILWSSLPGMLTFLRLRLIRVHLKLGKSNLGILSRSNCWQSDVFNWAPATPLLSFSDLACGGGDRYENLVTDIMMPSSDVIWCQTVTLTWSRDQVTSSDMLQIPPRCLPSCRHIQPPHLLSKAGPRARQLVR